MSLSKILYINCRFILETFDESSTLGDNNYHFLSEYFNKRFDKSKKIVIIDFENTKVNIIATISIEEPKKSPIYFTFNNALNENSSTTFVFLNCVESISKQINIRDFPKKENLFTIYKVREENRIVISNFKGNPESDLFNIFKTHASGFDDVLNIFETQESTIKFVHRLISARIKDLILNTKGVFYTIKEKDIVDNIEEDIHRLKSTPVHVNKYINVKPILENFELLSETAFYLSIMIKYKIGVPDYLVAPSKNSLILCSALTKYLLSEIVIINQVSPITSFNNFSTINKIRPNTKYAIILDFECMGTEIKVVKSILWSHGVDFNDVAAFPLISTKIYDDDNIGFEKNRIFPVYKLEDSFDYKIFTQTTCPICNDLENCEHKKCFF